MVCQCTMNAVAYAALAYIFFRVFKAIYNVVYPFYAAPAADLHRLAGAKWAVVTGSTDGIGKSYAFELANKGFNILLVSRNPEKLNATKEELQKKYSTVEIKTLSFDFTNGSVEEYEKKVVSELQKLEVGILVNNVGYSYEYPDVLHKVEGGMLRLRDVLVVNTIPATILSAAVLPQMTERHKGIIINISSSAAYTTMQMWSVYSATKKYITHFTECIRGEYADKGITIQAVCPMMVATKMSKVRNASFFTPSPKAFVKQAVRSIGNIPETTGCVSHEIQAWLFGLPTFVTDFITTNVSKKTRAAALKKRTKKD